MQLRFADTSHLFSALQLETPGLEDSQMDISKLLCHVSVDLLLLV